MPTFEGMPAPEEPPSPAKLGLSYNLWSTQRLVSKTCPASVTSSFSLSLYHPSENCQIQLICQINAFKWSWNYLWGVVEHVFLQCMVIAPISPLPFSLVSPDVSFTMNLLFFFNITHHALHTYLHLLHVLSCVAFRECLPCGEQWDEWVWEGFWQLQANQPWGTDLFC